MISKRARAGIASWLNSEEKSQFTILQYLVHVRKFDEQLKSKPIERANRADILRYVRRYDTHWTRRRALTAIRSCFQAFEDLGIGEADVALSVSLADVENDVAKVSARVLSELRAAGLEGPDVAGLTWAVALRIIFHSHPLASRQKLRASLERLAELTFSKRTSIGSFGRQADDHVF